MSRKYSKASRGTRNGSAIESRLLQEAPPHDRIAPSIGSLLDLSNDVRKSLRDIKSMGPRRDELMQFLGYVVKSECNGSPIVSFATMQAAHLDKLLIDILDPAFRSFPPSFQTQADCQVVETLQRQWRSRFQELFSNVDQFRLYRMCTGGCMKNVELDASANDLNHIWRATSVKVLSEIEGDQHFDVGHWWPDLACAQRDGIVSSKLEKPTRGRYNVVALPLLSGREEVQSSGDLVRYVRQGNLSDMHLELLTQVGSKMRIFRGHELDSPLAPCAGIRYDGVYILRQYGQRNLAPVEKYQVILTLERIPGQKHLWDISCVPTMAQLDEWKIFRNHEKELVKQSLGPEAYKEWKIAKVRMSLE